MMTVNDFTTLVLRALGYNDTKGDFSWSQAAKNSEDFGLYISDKLSSKDVLAKNFTRGSMSYISYNALFFKNTKTGERMIDKLIK